jgi:hypothetical protein
MAVFLAVMVAAGDFFGAGIMSLLLSLLPV